jgi:hypothetical protein
MIIAGIYSQNKGRETIEAHYAAELDEVSKVIATVDSERYRTKESKEKTKHGRLLYHPKSLNSAFKDAFQGFAWKSHKVFCAYSSEYYTPDYTPPPQPKGAFREMDFVKNGVGVEVQFGKYAFMVYNVCAKMTIFKRLEVIKVEIEIVPVLAFAKQMSSGVSYFEQFVWDLENRGIADIDVPVLVIGVAQGQERKK